MRTNVSAWIVSSASGSSSCHREPACAAIYDCRTVLPTHLQLPYTLQWNASIEQALGKSQALTVSYVGSHAARLLQENQISTRQQPKLQAIFIFVENGLTSDYDALQVQFRRRLSRD